MFLDDDELPVIEPIECTQSEERNNSKPATQTKQVVITITPEEWEEIVRVFEIEVPVIKDLRKSEILKEKNNRSASSNNEANSIYEGKGKGKGKKKLI